MPHIYTTNFHLVAGVTNWPYYKSDGICVLPSHNSSGWMELSHFKNIVPQTCPGSQSGFIVRSSSSCDSGVGTRESGFIVRFSSSCRSGVGTREACGYLDKKYSLCYPVTKYWLDHYCNP